MIKINIYYIPRSKLNERSSIQYLHNKYFIYILYTTKNNKTIKFLHNLLLDFELILNLSYLNNFENLGQEFYYLNKKIIVSKTDIYKQIFTQT